MIVEVHYRSKMNDAQFEIPDNAIVTGCEVVIPPERERLKRTDVRYSISYVVPVE